MIESRGHRINEKELKCLLVLHRDDEKAFYFRFIASETELTEPEVRRAVRSLARKGLAQYHRGLFDDDGMVAGSGYGITTEGNWVAAELVCQHCGESPAYSNELCIECQEEEELAEEALKKAGHEKKK